MTALNDVLKAEKKADEMIDIAKKEAESMIASAKAEQKKRLEDESVKLEESSVLETKTKQSQVDNLVKDIASKTEEQVVAVKKRFLDKKEVIKSALLSHFQ